MGRLFQNNGVRVASVSSCGDLSLPADMHTSWRAVQAVVVGLASVGFLLALAVLLACWRALEFFSGGTVMGMLGAGVWLGVEVATGWWSVLLLGEGRALREDLGAFPPASSPGWDGCLLPSLSSFPLFCSFPLVG